MNLEKILHVLMQEVSRPDYLRQFENIKCDDQYYYLYKHLSFDPKLQVLNLFKKLSISISKFKVVPQTLFFLFTNK